jgi:hypothetical protein
LSEWDQIQLLEILQKKIVKLTRFKRWMQSSNDSVISFSLKLARIFNQYETNEYIFPLFNHPNIAIRIEAIDLISHLGF